LARKDPVILIPIGFPTVHPGQDLSDVVAKAIQAENLNLRKGDVVAIASKVVSLCEKRIVKLHEVRVSARARRSAKRWEMDERLASLVLGEADTVLGGVKGFLLTIKDGILTANAGVDLKNSPPGTATLWPEKPDNSARRVREFLQRKYKTRLGVEIVDSRVTPLRLGTVGLAIGLSGFRPVQDERNSRDLYGRRVRVTQSNIADDLAASSHMLMGESKQRVGAVVLRNAPIRIESSGNSSQTKLNKARCLVTSNLTSVDG